MCKSEAACVYCNSTAADQAPPLLRQKQKAAKSEVCKVEERVRGVSECVCVCVRERERERERKAGSVRKRRESEQSEGVGGGVRPVTVSSRSKLSYAADLRKKKTLSLNALSSGWL